MTWGRGTFWVTSIAFSLVLLGLVVAQVDWQSAGVIAERIDYRWVGVGLAILMVEGFLASSRFQLLVRTPVRYSDCLRVTAWYGLMLIGLPARLGEVVGVALIVRYMNQRTGTAVASLLFQRLFDVIVLALISVVVCLSMFSGARMALVFALAMLFIGVLVGLMIFLEELIAAAVHPLLARRHEKWPRRILRMALQARTTRRHHMGRGRTLKLGTYTVLKWIANLTAIGCVVIGIVPVLAPLTAVGIGIVYNLTAVIPLSTIGGFGISEAALLGTFTWLGYSLAVGAPIAIAIRLVLVSAPIIFWLAVIIALPRPPSTAATGESS
ncbi:MAG: uncharacterized membrane protein YbhN (UPF0104 family) [Gammaproteobacteria bacterium]|jgi:uncharacterized membrane protein YbhN (UPF0104 family)